MNSIIVGFSKPKSWFEPFSWLIRLAYWSPISHAYIKFNFEKLNKQIVFQASGLEVNFIGQILFDEKENVYKEFTFQMEDEKYYKLLQFAVDQLGEPYSIKGILGIMWVRICSLLGIKVNNPVGYTAGSGAFCSELTAYILENFADVNIDVPVGDLAPSQVLAILEKLPTSSNGRPQSPSL